MARDVTDELGKYDQRRILIDQPVRMRADRLQKCAFFVQRREGVFRVTLPKDAPITHDISSFPRTLTVKPCDERNKNVSTACISYEQAR